MIECLLLYHIDEQIYLIVFAKYYHIQWAAMITIMLLLQPISTVAQVTIGSSLKPRTGALLDLKEYDSTPNNTTAGKGLGLPRVELISNSVLTPIVETNEDTKQQYIGLMLYNVGAENLESVDSQICKGIHIWNGQKWMPLKAYPKHTFGQNVIRCVEGPSFTINCNTIKVVGLYKKNVELDASHYVEVTVNFPADYIGKEYILQAHTNTGTDIQFSAKGQILSTQQTIRLQGTGKPTTVGSLNMQLVSNSSSTTGASCSFQVEVALPKMRIVGVGSANYQPASQVAGSRSYSLLMNSLAFGTGPNAKVKVEGFEFENYHYRTDAQWIAIFQSKPDVVIRSYDNILGDAVAPYIKQYVEAGGVFIDFNDNNNRSNAGVKAMYGAAATSNTNSVNPGKLTNFLDVDDEIMKGPFSSSLSGKTLSGKNWREDASYSQGVTNVPLQDIILYSQSESNGKYLIFRDKTRNYIYVGDGGFLSGAASASSCCYPFQLDSSQMPTTGYQGEGYNSYLFANIMAWALKQAATNGINEW